MGSRQEDRRGNVWTKGTQKGIQKVRRIKWIK
jgi:hypothetical protein